MANVRKGDKISVRSMWTGGRLIGRATVIGYGSRRIRWSSDGHGGSVKANDEGRTWARGWDGDAVRALEAVAALDDGAADDIVDESTSPLINLQYTEVGFWNDVEPVGPLGPLGDFTLTGLALDYTLGPVPCSSTGVTNIASTPVPASANQRDTPSNG